MPSPITEKLHDKAQGLDLRPAAEAADILVRGQIEAAEAVLRALPSISDGAGAMARSLAGGGLLVYLGAGSSGLMAAADALELGGTFGIASDRVRILMAGGLPTSSQMPGATEDDDVGLEAGLAELRTVDTVIAVAASGTTPYTLNGVRIARARGATVVGIANNPDSPLLRQADVPVLLETPPEVISGSTRMGAGTAQKIALNTMSTLMGIALGHVCDGMMVNLVADNIKLRRRAAGIVQAISGADDHTASLCLANADGDVKLAVLLAAGAATPETARSGLDEAKGNLRSALDRLRQT